MSLTSRASGRKRYLRTAFKPTSAGGNLLRWVVKGTQNPTPLPPAARLLPYGKQRERSLRSGTAQEGEQRQISCNTFPLGAPKPHRLPRAAKCIPSSPDAPQPLRSGSPGSTGHGRRGRCTVVPQPEVRASIPLLTCQTPSSVPGMGY